MDKDIKILFLAANPLSTSRLRLDEEIRSIEQALILSNSIHKFDISQHWATRANDLQFLLLRHQPDIVHFSGHGTSHSEIVLENEFGKAYAVPTNALSDLFSLLRNNIKCVVLNACLSDKQALAISEHIEFVIGMSDKIEDPSAVSFSTSFYQALGFGKDIKSAYDLACNQLSINKPGTQFIPKLYYQNNRYSVHQLITPQMKFKDLLASKSFDNVLINFHNRLLHDQIEISGGWGKSQYDVMKKITSEELTSLEKREGGFISTFIALRALLAYEGSKFKFRKQVYSQKACDYITARQTKKGGYGRYVESISGVEIHASLRHTAFAISSLIDLSGPPEAIYNGIKYISKNWTYQDILDDAAPSLAISGIIYSIEKFFTTPQYFQLLVDDEKKEIDLIGWQNTKIRLIRELSELAFSTKFRPFFPPYGQHKAMEYDTAITTIDLISNPLPDSLSSIVIDILSEIMNSMIDNGIPYNKREKKPDIGISAYLISLLARPSFLESLNNPKFADELLTTGICIANFIQENYKNPTYNTYTYCDTMANLLLVREDNNEILD